MALSVAFAVSKRVRLMAAAFACLMLGQLTVASCTPDPAPYAVRIGVSR